MRKSWVVLLSSNSYLEGVFFIQKNLKAVKSKYPLHVMVTDNLKSEIYEQLKENNFSYEIIPYISSEPSKDGRAHWRNTISKLYVFKASNIDRAVYLDLDLLILQNIDHLFDTPGEMAMPLHTIYDLHDYKVKLIGNVIVYNPSEELFNKIFNFYKHNTLHIPEGYGDEPFIEAYAATIGCFALSSKYNFQLGLFSWNYVSALQDIWGIPYIIHFTSNWKPWMKLQHQPDIEVLEQNEFVDVPSVIKKIYQTIYHTPL